MRHEPHLFRRSSVFAVTTSAKSPDQPLSRRSIFQPEQTIIEVSKRDLPTREIRWFFNYAVGAEKSKKVMREENQQWKESVAERRFLKMEEGDNTDKAERAEDGDEKVEEADR
ncbi:unnamed protein product [Vicia faba]|uniref:Uncharacterized protein n=1 Tax=Vicia faba TaxID=3906 RepID=A0AAV1B7M3_VICFA|nr:unnamed protein product [Vicia faba]